MVDLMVTKITKLMMLMTKMIMLMKKMIMLMKKMMTMMMMIMMILTEMMMMMLKTERMMMMMMLKNKMMMMMLKTERMMMMMMLKTKTMMMKIVMTIMMIENTIVMNNQFHQFHHHCSFNHHTFIKLPTTMIVKMKDMLMKLTVMMMTKMKMMMMFPIMMKPMKMKLPQKKCLIPMMLVFMMTKAASADCPTLQSSRGEMEIISSRADDNDPDCTPGVTLRNKGRCQTFYFKNLDFSTVTQAIEPIYFHTYCLLD